MFLLGEGVVFSSTGDTGIESLIPDMFASETSF